MPPDALAALTAAVAPVVMVSAAGLLFMGIQAKNLHLSDRIRSLMAELRLEATLDARRRQLLEQLPLFDRRVRLSQWALNMLYVAIFCFVMTSLLLTSALWIVVLPAITTTVFAVGVAVLVIALMLEFVEMSIALQTIKIETRDAGDIKPR
jgi:hypothetical protein